MTAVESTREYARSLAEGSRVILWEALDVLEVFFVFTRVFCLAHARGRFAGVAVAQCGVLPVCVGCFLLRS